MGTIPIGDNFPWESIAVLIDVLKRGSAKHPDAFWRTLSVFDHANKANGHLKDFLYEISVNSQGEDTLAHAFVRLAMAVAVREQKEAEEAAPRMSGQK